MKVSLREIHGPWDAGWVLDKHMFKSTYLGEDAHGHPRFDNERTDVGEATYQLKYQSDWSQAERLAKALADNVYPKFRNVGLIVPMPATKTRRRQPVTEVVEKLGKLVGAPVFTELLLKAPNGESLKDLTTKQEKIKAIGGSLSVKDCIEGDDRHNLLLVDDLFDTGASMEAACTVLRAYPKVARIYVAALTWR
jgi:predicted amidophosphoribosyltransferase